MFLKQVQKLEKERIKLLDQKKEKENLIVVNNYN